MLNNDLEKDKMLYTLAVMRYKEENPNIDFNELFTDNWNISRDYHLKNIIIAEAIQNKVLVNQTNLYKKYFKKK